MITNINRNITDKICKTCKWMNIYLCNEELYWCANNLSDQYYVDLIYTCKFWEPKEYNNG